MCQQQLLSVCTQSRDDAAKVIARYAQTRRYDSDDLALRLVKGTVYACHHQGDFQDHLLALCRQRRLHLPKQLLRSVQLGLAGTSRRALYVARFKGRPGYSGVPPFRWTDSSLS